MCENFSDNKLKIQKMTIQSLIDGVKLTWIHVNVIEELSPSRFIVGDSTGLAIMEIAPGHEKHVEIGQGIRLLKPNKITDIHTRTSAMNDVEVVENWQSLTEDEISFDNKFTRANPTVNLQ